MPDSSARWTQTELHSFSPKVNLAISPLQQEEFLKWLPDPSTYARNPHLSDFPGFTQITDKIHGSWVRMSPYSTKEPGETEEMTSSHPMWPPHRQVLRYEDRNGTREICSVPVVPWETYLCYGTSITTLVWFWLSFPGHRMKRGDRLQEVIRNKSRVLNRTLLQSNRKGGKEWAHAYYSPIKEKEFLNEY